MTAFVFLADGFEDIEALTPVDLMRRAGIDVTTVSITEDKRVKSANGVTVEADVTFKDADFSNASVLVVPGGMPGATNLHNYEPLNNLLSAHAKKDGLIASICASPAVVLTPLGLTSGKKATCYPSFQDVLIQGGAKLSPERVVRDGQLITSNGPSSATLFALELVKALKGEDIARDVATGILLYPGSMPYYF